jgi:streptogramin lyase
MSRLHSRLLPAFVVLSTLPLLILTGCGAATSFSNPSVATGFKGKVFGGQQPVVGSTVTVWAAGITGYGSAALPLSSTTTLDDGSFDFSTATPYVCTPGEQVYITASGGTAVVGGPANANIMLATGLGDCTAAQTATVEINEVTTAATAFALAQFFTPTLGSSSPDSFGTDPADIVAFTNSNQFTIPTLIDIPNGLVQPNTPSITIESAKIYSIANTLASCVNDAAGFPNCNTLFTDTAPPGRGATTPTDTLQAAVQMALRPYQNIHGLYTLATKTPPFTGLSAEPNDWTIGVSYTSSDYALSIVPTAYSSTSASIDIDVNGKIWFPTTLSGSTGIAAFDPTSVSFNGPYLEGAYTQPQYASIDSNGYVWLTDVASSFIGYTDTTAPGGPNTVGQYIIPGDVLGPVATDSAGDTLFAINDPTDGPGLGLINSSGGGFVGAFTEYPTGLLATSDYVLASSTGIGVPCDLESVDNAAANVVYASTSPATCTSGGVALASGGQDVISMASSLNQFCFALAGACGGPPSDFAADVNLPQGVATDGYGNEWIANSGNASVFTFGGVNTSYANTSPVAYLHDTNNGSTMTTPYAIAIDGSGNVWIANAGCVATSTTGCTPGSFVLSELIGAAGPTITPLSSQMVNNGYLVGQLPGTIVPIPAASATPHRFGPAANAQGSAKSWSKTTGKPFVFIR